MSDDEPDGNSSDEENKSRRLTYFIVESAWQSQALIEFFRILDKWHIQDLREKVGDKATGGNPPRKRVPVVGGRVADTPAPQGLWRNCYNATWLANLKPHVRRRLQVIDEDYDFTLPEYEEPTDEARERVRQEKAKAKAKGKGKAKATGNSDWDASTATMPDADASG